MLDGIRFAKLIAEQLIFFLSPIPKISLPNGVGNPKPPSRSDEPLMIVFSAFHFIPSTLGGSLMASCRRTLGSAMESIRIEFEFPIVHWRKRNDYGLPESVWLLSLWFLKRSIWAEFRHSLHDFPRSMPMDAIALHAMRFVQDKAQMASNVRVKFNFAAVNLVETGRNRKYLDRI